MTISYYLIVLAIAAGLGFIPANIAKKKGYSFGLWWFYGWMLFIVAIIHVNLIPDKNAQAEAAQGSAALGAADALKQFKELLDAGAITQEEYDAKKRQLLGL